MSSFCAGIDLGARSSWLCVVDAKGQKRLDCKMPNDPQRILSHLKRFVPSLQAVVQGASVSANRRAGAPFC